MEEKDVSNKPAESSAQNGKQAAEEAKSSSSNQENTKATDTDFAQAIISEKSELSKEGKLEISPGEKLKLPSGEDFELTPKNMLDLAKRLKDAQIFNYARRILARTAHHPALYKDEMTDEERTVKLKIFQEWALCTYKDLDSPTDLRLDKALDILSQAGNLEEKPSQETLGLSGAIYKRKWEVDNLKVHLERSLLYYKKGYEQGSANDRGYTGINAAFIYDLLARQEEDEAKKINQVSVIAEDYRKHAAAIREDIKKTVSPLIENEKWLEQEWWYYSTIAEAHFGLKEYEKTVEWLQRGLKTVKKIPGWEKESTIRQFARLAMTQTDSSLSGEDIKSSQWCKTLNTAFGGASGAARTGFSGKIGLALSGGGFRASLFHIGTLAKLAELGVLRYVEVLSCVSGGSIIGAHYYLEVRKLLEENPDADIDDESYIGIVKKIETDFLNGVKKNIRMRIATGLMPNLNMLFNSGYTRSTRLGELYERLIFSQVGYKEGEKAPRFLKDLKIQPKDAEYPFVPVRHNWSREAKVPILVLNATALNTGHNWQFTVTWMGEPPSSINSEVDTNDQLRRMYYEEAAEAAEMYKDSVSLGDAVAASACVPGLFDAVSLKKLYEEDRIVRLVDGGVCDNQGVSGLLEQECNVILVSDASGQMESQKIPSNGMVGALLRSNTILQARIRDAQYRDLERRRRSSLLREMMFVHLKEGLRPLPINWEHCRDPFSPLDDLRVKNKEKKQYKIAPAIQKYLASIRTDLDSFSEIEAYALMTVAYRMTEAALDDSEWIKGFSKTVPEKQWEFLKIEDGIRDGGGRTADVERVLGVSGSVAFKLWRMRWRAIKNWKVISMIVTILFISALVLAAGFLIWWFVVPSFRNWLTVPGVALGLFGLVCVIMWLSGRKTLSQIVIGIIITPLGWFFSHVFLWINRGFLKRGSAKPFEQK